MTGVIKPLGQVVPMAPIARAPRPRPVLPDPKYRTPVLRAEPVQRSELLERLDDSRAQPLVLVTAPAGYGKTTLLAEWAERGGRPFAWVNLDPGDGDSRRLGRAILTGLERAGVDPGRPGHGFALVLDDAHLVPAGVLEAGLLEILGWIPPGSQVAVASRREPRLPLGAMRGGRLVCELQTADLSMSDVEGSALLRKAGLDAGFTAVKDLVGKTEGWPVLLELAARSAAPGSGAQEGIAGDDHLIADYFRSEVLGSMSRATKRFLVRTSVLDRLSGPLCDAVLERTRSAALLARMVGENVPVTPIDRHREWYRLHGMFREMLLSELRRSDPEALPGLHRRAGDWHKRRGDIEQAIEHAHRAGDVERVGALLWPNLGDYLGKGRHEVVARWVAGVGPDEAVGSSSFALAAAHSQLASGEIVLAEHWARAAAASPSARSSRGSRTEEAGALIVDAWAGRSGIAQMGKDAARAYRLLPDVSRWRAVCCFLSGTAALFAGDHANARARLEHGAARGLATAPDAATLCLAQLAVVAMEAGDDQDAGDLARQAIETAARHDLSATSIAVFAAAAAAAVAGSGHRLDEAKAAALRCGARAAALEGSAPWFAAETKILHARSSLALGLFVDAREQLAGAARIARRMPDAAVFTPWFDRAWEQFDDRAENALIGVATLTAAELRVLRFLPTHYAFHEIATQLHVSSNTVKTHVHAVYRKLDASSRSEAVANATRAGLLGS